MLYPMAFGIAEGLATISAAMQAVDFLEKHRIQPSQLIQTLNINYHPERFEHVEREIIGEFGDAYNELFTSIRDRALRCVTDLNRLLKDSDAELEIERKAGSLRGCVCRNLGLVPPNIRDRYPDDLKREWRDYRCEEYGGNVDAGKKNSGDLKVRRVATAS